MALPIVGSDQQNILKYNAKSAKWKVDDILLEGEHRRVCQIGFYKAVAAIHAHVKGEMDKARASLAARH